jgi:hypothetical protein
MHYRQAQTPTGAWNVGVAAGRDKPQIIKDLKSLLRRTTNKTEREKYAGWVKFAKDQERLIENVY